MNTTFDTKFFAIVNYAETDIYRGLVDMISAPTTPAVAKEVATRIKEVIEDHAFAFECVVGFFATIEERGEEETIEALKEVTLSLDDYISIMGLLLHTKDDVRLLLGEKKEIEQMYDLVDKTAKIVYHQDWDELEAFKIA